MHQNQITPPDVPLQSAAPELRPLQSDVLGFGFDRLHDVPKYVDLNADSEWKRSDTPPCQQ